MTMTPVQIQDAGEWQAGFQAGVTGKPSGRSPSLAWISGFIEGQAKRGATAREDRIVKNLFSKIEFLRDSHPDYFAYFEDTDADTAPHAAVVDLIASAPNEELKFFLLGKLTMRLSLTAMSGRGA